MRWDVQSFAAALTGVGEVIAERTFEVTHLDGSVAALKLEIGRPMPVPDGDDSYYCPYQYSGAGGVRIFCAFGVDPLQALILALHLVATELEVSIEGQEGRLRWLGEVDLGLRVPKLPLP